MPKIAIILILGFLLRILLVNWDQGLHLHPDERMLIFVAERIHFFTNFNPDFFNYGSLPIYILKGVSQFLSLFFGSVMVSYDGMLYVGRVLSTLADVATIFVIYKTVQLLFKHEKTALLASFFYTIAFFPIQNSHFFIVDTFLTLFVSLITYFLLLFFKRPSSKNIFFTGLFLAAAVTSKFTAIIFLPFILVILTLRVGNGLLGRATPPFNLLVTFFLFSFLFMPYAFLDYQKYLADISLQLKLNSDPYIFPYTLQYVGSLPYLYYLKNVFFFGVGPFISALAVAGLYFILKKTLRAKKEQKTILLIYITFNFFFFLIVGQTAVKFMRYLLPIYPFFSLLAGYGAIKTEKVHLAGVRLALVFSIVWSLLFLNIYTKEHTRITASKWILKNVPAGATLAVEHWDDRLPVYGGEKYNFEELTLYDQPDNDQKWLALRNKLNRSDYIIIASNRLYVPIQKLVSCTNYKVCFPLTSSYYQRLFAGELGYQKVAEFTSYPNLFGFGFKDDWADESFTVYDHPKVMIFKKL